MDSGHEDRGGIVPEVVGGSAAAGLVMLTGDPTAVALVGPAVAPVFVRGVRHLSAELQKRGLSPWQRRRVLTAADYARVEMQGRIERGETPRDDFFESADDNRPDFEEMLEEVFRIAGDTADERKIPYIGRLYGSLLFAKDIYPFHARFLCRLVESLTYRQLLTLAVVAETRDKLELSDPPQEGVTGAFHGRYYELLEEHVDAPIGLDSGLIAELDDLANRDLIGLIDKPKEGERVMLDTEPLPRSPSAMWGDEDSTPIWIKAHDRIRVTPRGRRLVELCGMTEVPAEERRRFLNETWRVPAAFRRRDEGNRHER